MARKRKTWIPVVTGLIQSDQRVLMGQRPEQGTLPGVWEFPGGKVEPNEQPEDALKRELSEELGIQAEIGPLRFATTHNYGEVGLMLLFYHIQFWKGQPKAIHHSQIKWMPIEELPHVELPEANQKALSKILSTLNAYA